MKSREQIKLDKEATKNLRAVGRYLRCPPSKARVRGRTLVGLPVAQATALLQHSPASSARLLLKVLSSAVANASRNQTSTVNGVDKSFYDVDRLVVDRVMVDQGPMLKRHHPVSHGAAKALLKRFCHITIYLKPEED